MPPRLEILKTRWSTADLPILPFLAPRVFKPWPLERRRTHWQGHQVRKKSNVGDDLRPKHQAFTYGQTPNHHTQYRVQAEDVFAFDAVESQSGNGQVKTWRDEQYYDQERRSQGGGGKRQISEDEEFSSKYEETWGTPIHGRKGEKPAQTKPPSDLRPTFFRYTGSHRDIINGFRRPRFGPAWARARERWLEERKSRQAFSRRNVHLRIQSDVYLRHRIPKARPKFTSFPLRAGTKFAWTRWNRSFAVLNLRYERFMRGRKIPREFLYHSRRPTVRLPEELQKCLAEHASSISFRQAWENLDWTMRSSIWPELIITVLENHADQALNVLEATYMDPYPPAFAVSDCLDYIICHKFHRPTSDDLKDLQRFVRRIRVLLYLGVSERVYLPQRSICLLLSHLAVRQNRRLYVTLTQVNNPLHENTLLHFASRFAQLGSKGVPLALEVLQRMKDLGCNLNRPIALSVFSTLLERTERDADARQLDSTILKLMMDSGVSPNIITYNILLQNSMRDGDFKTGWNIYEMIAENGIEPDAYTYSSLLNDSKNRMDAEAIKRVISIVRDKGIRSPHIVTDVLHAIFLLHYDRQNNPIYPPASHEGRDPSSFDSMFKVYSEYFHDHALSRLIPSFSTRYPDLINIARSSQDVANLQHPQAPTLVVMVTAYLRDLRNSTSARNFYEHFNELLVTGDPVAVELAKTTHIWNAIILTFSRFGDRLADCPEVVGNMLSNMSNPRSALAKEHKSQFHLDPMREGFSTQFANGGVTLAPISIPEARAEKRSKQRKFWPPDAFAAPDVYTWSILLKIFMDYQQPRAAERVLEMMKERGVEPNHVTWNTMVAGYSRMQDPAGTADAVRRMKDAGFEPDEVTMRALAKVHDKRTLLAAMDRNEALESQATDEKEGLSQVDLKHGEDDLDGDDLIELWERVGESQVEN